MRTPTTTPLRVLRRELELSQEVAAALAGCSQGHWSRVERGLKPATEAFRLRVQQALGCNPFIQPTEDDS